MSTGNKPLSISEFTAKVRSLIEGGFPSVSVAGEISNFRSPGSGHWYFTLKDASAVLQAVMFRGDAMRVRFPLSDGMAVVATGRITVYEARGQYQIQVQSMQPVGMGSLQEQFEALKRKLAAEGIFDLERKKPLPVFPECVGIVTSLQGAVLQDFLRILGRRAPGIRVKVHGVRVQGDGAAVEIASAIEAFNRDGGVDLIVIARGGGSLEDLWAFNEEVVARSLAASALPTVSAVGHETDVTIADFAADLRAPTPSAAAELISRDWQDWRMEVEALSQRVRLEVTRSLERYRERVERSAQSYVFREPIRVVHQLQQRVDDLTEALKQGLKLTCRERRHALEMMMVRWTGVNPRRQLDAHAERLTQWQARLEAMSPRSTLNRGYAWVQDSEGKLVTDPDASLKGKEITVTVAKGKIGATVQNVSAG